MKSSWLPCTILYFDHSFVFFDADSSIQFGCLSFCLSGPDGHDVFIMTFIRRHDARALRQRIYYVLALCTAAFPLTSCYFTYLHVLNRSTGEMEFHHGQAVTMVSRHSTTNPSKCAGHLDNGEPLPVPLIMQRHHIIFPYKGLSFGDYVITDALPGL